MGKPLEDRIEFPPPVLTKGDFVRRYQRGEFGNHSPTWDTLEDFESTGKNRDSGVSQLYHLRNRVKGGSTWYNLTGISVAMYWRQASREGYPPEQLYISAMAPTAKTLFQGEVIRGYWGLELTCTLVAKPMREALAECVCYARGAEALSLLLRFLDFNSYGWLRTLLDRYSDHVVEFSTYSVEWGSLPGFNTVFWEVRKY